MVGTILKNPKRMVLYSLQTPVIYSITTEIENGTISPGTTEADYGSKFKVEYTPDEDYEVKEIWVDKEQVEVRKYLHKYTFDNIDKDQTIRVVCTKVPQYYIKGTALNGTIDEETLVYANTKVVVNFAPKEHYQLKSVFVDGHLVEIPLNASNYEFEKVNEDHEIYAEFEEIPRYKVTVKVVNGYTNELEKVIYQGEGYVANFKPRNGYNLKQILVDDKAVEHEDNQMTYELISVSADHVIEIVYQWQYLYWLIGIGGAVILVGGMLFFKINLKRKKGRKRRRKSGK